MVQRKPRQKIITGKISKKSSRTKSKIIMSNELIISRHINNTNHQSNTKIAIVQTGSWGDNINSTLMLKPLRNKYPDLQIDILTSTKYGAAFHNNPLIDNIIEYNAIAKGDALHLLTTIPQSIQSSGYHKIYTPHPMINPDKWTSIKSNLGTNLICAWVRALEDDNIEYEVPLTTILKLTQEEIDKIQRYLSHIQTGKRNVIMETGPESGQSFFTDEWIQTLSTILPETNIFISCKELSPIIRELKNNRPNDIHFVGDLTIRECAELYNHCNIFFSCSSGLACTCNTNWCRKDVRWIEVVNSDVCNSGAIRSDNKVFWYDNNISNFIDYVKTIL